MAAAFSLSDTSRATLPWLLALIVAALTGVSFTGYEIGRPWLLFPSLALLAAGMVPLISRQALDLPFWLAASAGAFICVVIGNTVLNHPELLTPAFCNSIVMLVLTFVPLAAGMLHPQLIRNTRPLLLAMFVLEVALVGQTFFSYYTGWGEVINNADGVRRAYGRAGDSFTLLLVFCLLLNVLRNRPLRSVLTFAALFMSAGKLGLGITVMGLLLCLPLLRGDRKRMAAAGMTLLAAVLTGLLLTSAPVRNLFEGAGPQATASAAKLPNPNPVTRHSQRSLPAHLAASAAETGAGRLITFAAGYKMFADHPLSGVGYDQSTRPEIFQPAVVADVFGLKERLNLHPSRFSIERLIGNQAMLVAAENGLVGLVAFALMAALALILALRVWLGEMKLHRVPDDTSSICTVAAVWLICLVIFNQTSVWLVSGAAMTIWFGLMLGLCAARYRLRQDCAA